MAVNPRPLFRRSPVGPSRLSSYLESAQRAICRFQSVAFASSGPVYGLPTILGKPSDLEVDPCQRYDSEGQDK